jgi:AcrR family transcriptional regulator
MRHTPSLYSHFASKNAIYDAMYGQAWREFVEFVAQRRLPAEPREVLREIATMVDQQLANDPGGTRWRRLLGRVIDMYANEMGLPPSKSRRRR